MTTKLSDNEDYNAILEILSIHSSEAVEGFLRLIEDKNKNIKNATNEKILEELEKRLRYSFNPKFVGAKNQIIEIVKNSLEQKDAECKSILERQVKMDADSMSELRAAKDAEWRQILEHRIQVETENSIMAKLTENKEIMLIEKITAEWKKKLRAVIESVPNDFNSVYKPENEWEKGYDDATTGCGKLVKGWQAQQLKKLYE